ncbi:MAG: hypothetical protein FWD71_12805 [Oscillospiraceae bacterium]|nr:hypothetical protein [Oscillospiraceae bacterium]
MGKIVKLEYGDNQFVEVELKEDKKSDGGLGGVDKINQISKKIFDKSISSMVSFLNETGNKIKDDFNNPNISDISISIGVSINAEGNFVIVSSGTEVTFNLAITLKGDN